MTVFLSGPMGSGKTTLARAFAGPPLSLRVADLDDVVAEREGASVAEIFRNRGEAAFRAIERGVALDLARAGYDVVALGGGTVTDPATRRALLRAGTLVTLTAPTAVLAARVGDGASRPLLAGSSDHAATLAAILAARAEAYAECHATLDTSRLDADGLLREVLALGMAAPLAMPLGVRTYPIAFGPIEDAAREVARGVRPSRVVLVTDENTRAYARRAGEALEVAGLATTDVVLPAGEAHKTLASVEAIWSASLAARADRDTLVLAVGGGVVSDLAGFAAATLLRGVAFATLPTTLLAMVDASVGGKTGFDRPEGKNLIGAFHQPRFVLADVTTLATLPERELISGLAEVAKSAWLEGEADVAALEAGAASLRARVPAALKDAIRRSVATKIAIVADDEREEGVRAHLNLGHTLGHAIEAASGWTRTHGECVALGMIAALRIGVALGDATAADLARVTRLLSALGLPTDLDGALGDGRLADYLASDKKRVGDAIRFVVPGPPGRVRIERLAPGRVLSLARAGA